MKNQIQLTCMDVSKPTIILTMCLGKELELNMNNFFLFRMVKSFFWFLL